MPNLPNSGDDWWWDSLSDQQRIYWALRAAGYELGDEVLLVAEKPWKWKEEAAKLYHEEKKLADELMDK